MEKMVKNKELLDIPFFKGKKVFITGHTGFKGSWLSVFLLKLGAQVIGYSTCSKADTRLFDLCCLKNDITHIKGDVRDLNHLVSALKDHKPDMVVHMAAQPIVRESYNDPVGTYATNVMGTVNICEAIRQTPSVKSFLNVTTDKVYDNREWVWGYRECDPLDGYDPYSNSKSCSELVTHSYKKSFLEKHVAVSTARAGNVIGGGDFAPDRIIPDCVRFALKHEDITVRNPNSIRPYQHVLDPLYAYLLILEKQYKDPTYASWYNVGPNDSDCLRTGDLVNLFIKYWGNGLKRIDQCCEGPHEANFLKLDCSKLKTAFDWSPRWNLETAVIKVVDWTKSWTSNENVRQVMVRQIEEFLE
ncbi:CDP-glucose 4,6-dehydratase [Succinivibrio dextrinosolvens]|uniref:CDP-glucose 4,6-dehydratase n=1 Tax=Succinivibrio dextrinosolvens TaxID=83771 RepID=UPI0019204840|nr:CDP-glucose 4,6-dehydratase [Succinivibrio dextrinosolvens]